MADFTPQPGREDILRMPELACLHCGYVTDAVANAHSYADAGLDPPTDGDRFLCFRCAKPSAFVIGPLGISLRKLTQDEAAEFALERYELMRAMHERDDTQRPQ